ncbi:hypothetical protein MKAN_11670 [Mycobacterium kansasii ATCC 12478]|uniref:Uncharacterized protein n=1 Tax=Mycobacterium kansasii ATCC 12478 TaxID=557599 RepID=U5WYK5_MYCKA|nr:hypothetical protein MKAN_11670 [Mycobacterium kansasii ATCC 12478]
MLFIDTAKSFWVNMSRLARSRIQPLLGLRGHIGFAA